MHFISRNVNQPTRDSAYWRDLALGALGAISILGSVGHFLDWLKNNKPIDRDWGLGFLIAYGLFALLAPNRFKFVIVFITRHYCVGHTRRNCQADPTGTADHSTLCPAGLPATKMEGSPPEIGCLDEGVRSFDLVHSSANCELTRRLRSFVSEGDDWVVAGGAERGVNGSGGSSQDGERGRGKNPRGGNQNRQARIRLLQNRLS
jgi:hypothetical protein